MLRQDGAASFTNVSGVNVYKVQRRTINERFKIEYLLKLVTFLISHCSLICIRHRYDLIHVHSIPDFEVFAGAKLWGQRWFEYP